LLRALEFFREATTSDLENTFAVHGGFTANLWDSRSPEIEFNIDFETELTSENKYEDTLHYEFALSGPSLNPYYEVRRETLSSFNNGVLESTYVQRFNEDAFVLDSQDKQIDVPPDRMQFDQTLV